MHLSHYPNIKNQSGVYDSHIKIWYKILLPSKEYNSITSVIGMMVDKNNFHILLKSLLEVKCWRLKFMTLKLIYGPQNHLVYLVQGKFNGFYFYVSCLYANYNLYISLHFSLDTKTILM